MTVEIKLKDKYLVGGRGKRTAKTKTRSGNSSGIIKRKKSHKFRGKNYGF